jgi:GT2 family glycosyltransferase
MKNGQPLVSIITVNENQSLITCELLKSIHQLTYINIEVIVVDNASKADDPSIIEHQFPRIKLVRNLKSLGTAGAINLGLSIARGQYLLFINNNTEVTPGFLEPLVNFFKENPEAGIVSPKVKYFSDPEIIEYAGCTPLNLWTLQNRLIGYQEKDTGQHDMIIETSYAHSPAMMITSEVLKQAGKIPEKYVFFYEEMDWSERIKDAGFKIFYYPKSVVFLKESFFSNEHTAKATYYKNRNMILFARRNYKGKNKLIALLSLYCFVMPKKFYALLFKGRIKLAWALTKGVWWNLLTFKI